METPIVQLFVNFITNHCSPDEQAQVLAYLKSGGYEAEWDAALSEIETFQLPGDNLQGPANEHQLYQKIKNKAGINKRQTQPVKWLAYAASILFVCAAGFYFLKLPAKHTGLVAVTPISTNSPAPSTNRKWLKLADGTSVQLNKNSRLIYPESFAGKKTREVTLIGEAYFDVKHEAAHPFIIHTGNIKTTVLGTAFNISAYKANASVTVTVSRGKVIVQDNHQTLAVLTPNQQLAWTVTSKQPNKQTVDANIAIAWKAGDLIMDDITLEEASVMIAKRYQLKIDFKNDKVKSCRFTAAFLNRNDVSQVLHVLSDITGATLILKDDTVIIDGPGC